MFFDKTSFMKTTYLKFISILFLFCSLSKTSTSQDKTVQGLQSSSNKEIKKDKIDTSKIWNTGGQFNVNLAQGSQSNWAAGGDDFSFSLNSYLGFYAFYKKGRYNWDNTLDLNYGVLNTTSLGSRKSDDRIDLLSKAGYQIAPK